MAFIKPTATDFKSYFTRDFPFGTANNTVLDSDINKAIAEAGVNFNEGLFGDQGTYSMAYMYLTAHYLVMDLRASTQGISGSFPWMTNSKSVASVSEGFEIPEFVKNNPMLAHYGKTYYGAKYISLVYPRLLGNMFSSFGNTKA
jgi:hypothetical protein